MPTRFQRKDGEIVKNNISLVQNTTAFVVSTHTSTSPTDLCTNISVRQWIMLQNFKYFTNRVSSKRASSKNPKSDNPISTKPSANILPPYLRFVYRIIKWIFNAETLKKKKKRSRYERPVSVSGNFLSSFYVVTLIKMKRNETL